MFESDADLTKVAIIGYSCRFPGAESPQIFWNNLVSGEDQLSDFSNLFPTDTAEKSDSEKRMYSHGLLDKVELFDGRFFGMTPSECQVADPQLRLFLECAWEALESTGYINSSNYKKGVYAAAANSSYLVNNVLKNTKIVKSVGEDTIQFFNYSDFFASQVSYRLDLTGPCLNIGTACSSSLVAVAKACQSLINFDCDIALAGGVRIVVPQTRGYLYQPEGIMSADGKCRSFDAEASGTVGGNGVGIVVLKRFSDALKDKDEIDAVISGFSINNDGNRKVGYTASSAPGQIEVINTALNMALAQPDDITYVECHGSGTKLGDPVEVSAITQAYKGINTQCKLGSVKANIGHLDKAAGIAGLIKIILMIKHRKIVPQANFNRLNPHIELENTRFQIATELEDWNASSLKAGLSSFGIGGTNVHLIVEEHSKADKQLDSTCDHNDEFPFLFSADTEKSLKNVLKDYKEYLHSNKSINIANLSHTLLNGRKHFDVRYAFSACNYKDVLKILEHITDHSSYNISSSDKNSSVCFMFTGIGDHYVDIGLELYRKCPIFKNTFDELADNYKSIYNVDLRELLSFVEEYVSPGNVRDRSPIRSTSEIHPALFALQYAYAKSLITLGISPKVLIGYSLGEITAACIAGIISLNDALKLVTIRSTLIGRLNHGGMVAVYVNKNLIIDMLPNAAYISAVNDANNCVVSGTPKSIELFCGKLKDKRIPFKVLNVEHPFHSPLIAPIKSDFIKQIKDIKLNMPMIPVYSTLTGKLLSEELLHSNDYLYELNVNPVNFIDSITSLNRNFVNLNFVEIGPGNALKSFLFQNSENPRGLVDSTYSSYSAGQGDSEYKTLLGTVCSLWGKGVNISWNYLSEYHAKSFIKLPTYHFDRHKFWLEAEAEKSVEDKRNNIGERGNLYTVTHENIPLFNIGEHNSCLKHCIFIVSNIEDQHKLQNKLRPLNWNAHFLFIEDYTFNRIPNNNTGSSVNNFLELNLQKIFRENTVDTIVFAGNLNLTYSDIPAEDIVSYFESIVSFINAIVSESSAHKVNWLFLTKCGLVAEKDNNYPLQSITSGIARVLAQENEGFCSSHVSVENSLVSNLSYNELNLLSSFMSGSFPGFDYSIKNGGLWKKAYKLATYNKFDPDLNYLDNKVIVISGGLGNDSFERSKLILQESDASLVLLGRTRLPPESEWNKLLCNADTDAELKKKINRIQQLKLIKDNVTYYSCDVSEISDFTHCVDKIIERLKTIDCFIHSAGITDHDASRFLAEMDQNSIAKHFFPKIFATINLGIIADTYPIKTIILNSSIASLTGGVGLSAYTSASVYMDMYVEQRRNIGDYRWLTLNWSGTKPEYTRDVFRYVINSMSTSQLIYAHKHPDDLIRERLYAHDDRTSEVDNSNASKRYADMESPYIEPQNQIESAIADIWQEIIRIYPIGIEDKFYSLGGHSLMALRILLRMNEALGTDITLKEFLVAQTIKELANLVLDKHLENSDLQLESIN